jgi:hypothetical protein
MDTSPTSGCLPSPPLKFAGGFGGAQGIIGIKNRNEAGGRGENLPALASGPGWGLDHQPGREDQDRQDAKDKESIMRSRGSCTRLKTGRPGKQGLRRPHPSHYRPV